MGQAFGEISERSPQQRAESLSDGPAPTARPAVRAPVEMPRYYFDLHDGDQFITDETGLALPGIREARYEAIRVMADFARDAVQVVAYRELGVEVRDQSGKTVLTAKATFEVAELADEKSEHTR
jgi:hypothetical protein